MDINDSKKYFIANQNIEINATIIKLLWFADGTYKNYNYIDFETYKIPNINIEIRFTSSSKEEPSLIYSKLPIKINNRISPKDKIGYYPTYRELTPTQRFIYLEWLKNPFEKKEIDIGYVFLFYYGLERYLFLKNSQEAFEAIFKLMLLYKENYSFYNYSYNCLLYFSIISNQKEITKKLLTMKELTESSLVLYAKFFAKEPLFAEDIIELANLSGFKNKRYINLYYDLFKETLKDEIYFTFENNELYLDDFYNPLNTDDIYPVANISLRNTSISIPDFRKNEDLKKVIFNLLSSTHEKTKTKLKTMRKTK